MTDLEALIRISRYAGERFDLVQAGGGNSSVKREDGTMLIKASGFLLSDVDVSKGYATVPLAEVLELLADETLRGIPEKKERAKAAGRGFFAMVPGTARPSIETFLHALLLRYTLHTHPLGVNGVTCRRQWIETLRDLFGDRAAYVAYRTPGIELAWGLSDAVRAYVSARGKKPEIVFLQNHGLIVSSDDLDRVIELTDMVAVTVEKALKVDFTRYRLTNRISALIGSLSPEPMTSWLSEDAELLRLVSTRRDLFDHLPFCPDALVYCGMLPLQIDDLDDPTPFAHYRTSHGELPRVVLFKDHILFSGSTMRNARQAEEMFKFHVMALEMAQGDVRCLDKGELAYLGGWEAEQFRRKQ